MPAKSKRASAAPVLELRLLGPIEVWQGDERRSLPRSKKTRALLAYLAMTDHAHSRNRLCELFWDITDDPRGALRWSLSRLRKVVDDGASRIDADRERVAFAHDGVRVDARELIKTVKAGVESATVEDLEAIAKTARGEFLEGLELADFYEFQAWCVAQREQSREALSQVLGELVRRHDDPRAALPHARARVQADALSVAARIELLTLLVRADKTDEAAKQVDMTCRLFREVGAPGVHEIEAAWRDLSSAPATAPAPAPAPAPVPAPVPVAASEPVVAAAGSPFVGRTTERDRLVALLDESRARGTQRVALITGEPGAGKSRLAQVLIERAREAGSAILSSRAYEAESTRPYGPWVDALRTELNHLISNQTDENALPTRDALFGAVADATATRAASHGGALLILDDIQWLDRDSAELLHFVTRTNRQRPVFIALIARSGELADNEHALRALRSLRREVHIEEVALEPLTQEAVSELVAPYAGADAAAIFEACAGNPLFALELARAAADGVEQAPPSLVELVRGRIERLPAHVSEVLRWGAVLGHTVSVSRLQSLSELSLDELADGVERLEQHALLQLADDGTGDRYTFAHDVVREAVYGELSHPRRRLMHQRVAQLLEEDASNPTVATELAHHAMLGGNAMLGVRACIVAGLQSLRVFANGDAEALAKRGLRLVEDLKGNARTESTLELLHVLYTARSPDRDEAAARIRALTDEAVAAGLTKAARLGFQMLSYLRWEHGSMLAAHDNIMRAERVSRSAAPQERTVALSQAAKCLVLLERDLPLAESFLLEADSLTSQVADSPSAMHFAVGMMHEHRGELDDAVASFREARQLGRQQGDPLAEFAAIEHLMMLELDRGACAQALELAKDLAELGSRVRAGAEAACGRALHALASRYCGNDDATAALTSATADLRAADSKYRLAYVLTRLARLELRNDRADAARELAADALAVATQIARASEIVLAHALLAQCAHHTGDADALAEHLAALEDLRDRELSAGARTQLDEVTAELG